MILEASFGRLICSGQVEQAAEQARALEKAWSKVSPALAIFSMWAWLKVGSVVLEVMDGIIPQTRGQRSCLDQSGETARKVSVNSRDRARLIGKNYCNDAKGTVSTKIKAVVSDDWRSDAFVVEHDLANDLITFSGFEHGKGTVPGSQKNPAVGGHGRTSVSLGVKALLIELFTRQGIQAKNGAVLFAKVEEAFVKQWRRDVGRASIHSPKLTRPTLLNPAFGFGEADHRNPPVLGRRDNQQALTCDWGGNKTKSPIVLILRVESGYPPLFLFPSKGHGQCNNRCHVGNREIELTLAKSNGRRIRMLALGNPVLSLSTFHTSLPGIPGLYANDQLGRGMDQLEIKTRARRSWNEAKTIAELAAAFLGIEAPFFMPLEIEGHDFPGSGGRENKLSIRGVGEAKGSLIPLPLVCLNDTIHSSALLSYAHYDAMLCRFEGQKNFILHHDGRGRTRRRKWNFPIKFSVSLKNPEASWNRSDRRYRARAKSANQPQAGRRRKPKCLRKEKASENWARMCIGRPLRP